MNKSQTDSSGQKLPELKCPTCGYEMDAATDIAGDARPSVGDISLCVNCGEVLEFCEGLRLEVASLKMLMQLDPKQHLALTVAQRLIRKGDRKP